MEATEWIHLNGGYRLRVESKVGQVVVTIQIGMLVYSIKADPGSATMVAEQIAAMAIAAQREGRHNGEG